jgi:hypothetical protein
MRSLALATALLVGLPAVAFANGRAPGTSTINFQQGNDNHIAAGMTFGVVSSTDGGATWTWECEDAVGYGGMYDPDYAFTSTGALFATTFDGLKVRRDECSYNRSALIETDGDCFDDADADTDLDDCNTGFTCSIGVGGGSFGDGKCEKVKFFSAIAQGSDGAVYAAAADPKDGKIYKLTDNEVILASPQPGLLMDWWQSIEVAPSNAQVIYLTGYRLENNTKKFLLYKSTNGGTSYVALPGNEATGVVNGLDTKTNSVIEIAGISKTDPNLLYARVTLSDNAVSDAIYRSTNGGTSWTKIIEKAGALAFVARANGQLVAGTQAVGTFQVMDPGAATASATIAAGFTEVTGAPHINCLAENAAGEVWACTQNYGSPTVPKDDFGIMKTTDLTTWTGVLKFQELVAPTTCGAGTPQKERCDAVLWCGLCAQLGCDPARDCTVVGNDAAAPDGLVVNPPKPKTCCQSGSDDIPGLLIICMAASLVVLRRRRVRPT